MLIFIIKLLQLFVVIESTSKSSYYTPHNLRLILPTVEDQDTDWFRYLPERAPYMSEMTLCVWEKNLNPDNRRYFVSYAVMGDADHFGVSTYGGGVNVVVDDDEYSFNSDHDTNLRNHFCVTFSQPHGEISLFVNGMLKDTVDYVGGPTAIKGGGVWIFGQEQDVFGGGFDIDQSYSGDLTNFVIFRRVLTRAEVYKIAYLCVYPTDPYISPTFRQLEWHGMVKYSYSPCPKVKGPGE